MAKFVTVNCAGSGPTAPHRRGGFEVQATDRPYVPRRTAMPTPFLSLRLLCVTALAAWFFCSGCSRFSIPTEPPPPKGIVNLDEGGWEHVRAQQRGRVLLVNFWATWCEPCREEFPGLVRLYNTYRGRGLSVVAISMDEPESGPAIEQFLKSQGANFGSYRQNFKDFEVLVNSINPQWGGGIPATFLYDREERLMKSWQGATTFEEYARAVEPLLPKPFF